MPPGGPLAQVPTAWGSDPRRAGLLLVALAIAIPELLTGSTPFLTLFVSPLALPFLVGLYGGGVLAIREAVVRWNGRGWSLLLLGASYGIVEEGLATRTWFAPSSVIGLQGSFGRFDGLNVAWAVQLTLFHAIFSIALPILLTDAAFPSVRGRPILSTRQTVGALSAFTLTAGVMLALFAPGDRPPVGLLLVPLALALGAAAAAWWVRSRPLGGGPKSTVPRRRLFYLGTLGTSTFFAINWLGPPLLHSAGLVIAVELGVGGSLAWAAARYGPVPGDRRATVALASGLLVFLLAFALVLDVFGDWGVAVAVLGLGAFLYVVDRDAARTPGGSPVASAGIARTPG